MIQEQKTKMRQYILASSVLLVLVVVILLFISALDKPGANIKEPNQKNAAETKLTTAHNKVNPQESWRAKMEEEQDRAAHNTKDLRELLENYQQESNTKQNELRDLLQQAALEKQQHINEPVIGLTATATSQETKIAKFTLNLDTQINKMLTTIDNTIPAGTFARAVLLSGVDAVTSINIKADPRPMLLRIIDFGNMPRKFTTDLVDCHCTAAAWGELSSERIHTRIEKLSCVERATGEILEITAQGYLAGSDGKEGIRGTVVSKDGQFLNKSLWGGVFAGIGAVLSPANKQSHSGSFLNIGAPSKMSSNDMFKSGFGESANTSLNKLSEYYIQRAEQIQPVIQIAAGQEVDVIFTEGMAIDQSLLKKATATTNDKERKRTIEQHEDLR